MNTPTNRNSNRKENFLRSTARGLAELLGISRSAIVPSEPASVRSAPRSYVHERTIVDAVGARLSERALYVSRLDALLPDLEKQALDPATKLPRYQIDSAVAHELFERIVRHAPGYEERVVSALERAVHSARGMSAVSYANATLAGAYSRHAPEAEYRVLVERLERSLDEPPAADSLEAQK